MDPAQGAPKSPKEAERAHQGPNGAPPPRWDRPRTTTPGTRPGSHRAHFGRRPRALVGLGTLVPSPHAAEHGPPFEKPRRASHGGGTGGRHQYPWLVRPWGWDLSPSHRGKRDGRRSPHQEPVFRGGTPPAPHQEPFFRGGTHPVAQMPHILIIYNII